MDLSSMFAISLTWDFCAGCLAVILIDIVLAGDNAVVIALAVKSLPPEKRRLGIVFGAGFAVLLRVVLTIFAAQLLQISLVKLVGGILILWIAVKLLAQDDPQEEMHREAATLWSAIWIILIADITMSTDNVLALAGASKGNVFLLVFGLLFSIPLVVGGSALLSSLMDKYPVIIYIGAAVLGKVGGELILTDPFVYEKLQPSQGLIYAVEAFCAAGVTLLGKAYIKHLRTRRMMAVSGESEPVLAPPRLSPRDRE